MTVIAKTRQPGCLGTEVVADRLGLKSAYSEIVANNVAERLGVEEDTVLRYLECSPSLFERYQINEIAELIRSLTYGETVDLAAGLWKAAADAEITGETFPAILHRWASEHRNRPETPGTALLTLDQRAVG